MYNNIYSILNENANHEEEEIDKYLSFSIENSIFAINISYIQKIIMPSKILKIPNKSVSKNIYYIKNNNEIIPIVFISNQEKFFNESQNNKYCIILNMDNNTIALIVDEVYDIISIKEEDLNKSNIESNIHLNISALIDDKIIFILNEENFKSYIKIL
ncbi:MAG: chemotaxis protein CheW [Oscillospiraceae bacterium]|nr:chemotaxis protein CheW [Oscillospiraceae bacterium]